MYAADFYVDPLGLCGGNTPCYTTIQRAANEAGSGAVIKVAADTYTESLSMGTNSLTITGTGEAVEVDNVVLQEAD